MKPDWLGLDLVFNFGGHLLPLLFILFVGCSTMQPGISPELQPYVSRFFEEYQKHLDIKLSDDGNYYDRIEDHIRIKRDDWIYMSPTFREMLIMHEMLHMVGKKVHHNEKFLPDKCPYSIMFYRIDEVCYKRHKEWYLKEAFSSTGEFTRSGRCEK